MAATVALWTDSTYGYLEEKQVFDLAAELDFPLSNFVCSYGAGLITRGDEASCSQPLVMDTVIIEMGYNDDCDISADEAAKRMRKQTWFTTLVRGRSVMRRVIFISQPAYRQVAGLARGKRRKKAAPMAKGELIHGSAWTEEAARLVREEFDIETHVVDIPAEEQFVGFTRNEIGELWQDEAACRSYTDHGVEYTADGSPAIWCDAQHLSASGAAAHFRLLIAALRHHFDL
eukprot:TRINITY_DN57597_c0_g1_i1.p1 TRINITY_DN57597_c0_g1~~TRINITY_DN57597_c0_g1_i1.p1  ORF type:complete len:231 (+),score=31.29 TRINITY_DN57597_c0_g1_i1:80-772(+)